MCLYMLIPEILYSYDMQLMNLMLLHLVIGWSPMEYAIMLSEPDLVSGLQDLLDDPDPAVVKRTIRVFANVYRHALQLLAKGDLDEQIFTAAWPEVKKVAEKLMSMLSGAEHEGIIIHIVRFLEAALVAHLISDISRYPDLEAQSDPIIAKGIDAITDLLLTPYVGGSSFIVAMRAIITVACYKPDIRDEVVELIEKQISSPPPTLFDHNVRSLNKILQRNLFRLLRRASLPGLRSRLIDMMVTVGVSRRMLAQWAPPQEERKRPAQVLSNDDIISGRNTPPTKRQKNDPTSDEEGRLSPPSDPRESRIPKDPRLSKLSNLDIQEPISPRDPRIAQKGDIRELKASTSKSSTPQHSPPHDINASSNDRLTSQSNSPYTSGRSTPIKDTGESCSAPVTSYSQANFEFLKNLITSTKETKAAKPFLEKCTNKERALYERLDHPSVVELVLSCLESVPDSPPDNLLALLGYSVGDVDGIREHLTSILAPHITEDFINSLTPPHESNDVPSHNPTMPSRPSSASSASTNFSSRSSPPLSNHRESSPPSPPSSSRSTPTDPNQICVSDTDLRKFLDKGFINSGDVDMRKEPQRTSRDPRNSSVQNSPSCDSRGNLRRDSSVDDPRVSKNYPKVLETEQRIIRTSVMDPRITMNNANNQPNVMDTFNPGLPKPFADMRDPRISFPPPEPSFIMNNTPNFGNMGPDPRMNIQNGPFPQNYNNRFGVHCGMNPREPGLAGNMPRMNFGKGLMGSGPPNMNNGLGPMNGPSFVGGPGIFGLAPRPNMPMGNGPWPNMNIIPMPCNRPGIFSQVPPMHL
ncbi:hypothetical protein SK128_006709 [Halocaridina rubra]|uniref:Symplekin/Pta1 N-terminal domain-containing protein n=1 Tax=Halocaridina rubra TaxID=373956 RepID=A0AAN8WPW6_HALRR